MQGRKFAQAEERYFIVVWTYLLVIIGKAMDEQNVVNKFWGPILC